MVPQKMSLTIKTMHNLGFPGGADGKESADNEGDLVLIPGLGRSPGGGHGNPLQYSCLENPMDRGVQHSQKGWVVWFGGEKDLNDTSCILKFQRV